LAQYLLNLKNKYIDEFPTFNHIRELIPVSNHQDVFDKSLAEKLHTFLNTTGYIIKNGILQFLIFHAYHLKEI